MIHIKIFLPAWSIGMNPWPLNGPGIVFSFSCLQVLYIKTKQSCWKCFKLSTDKNLLKANFIYSYIVTRNSESFPFLHFIFLIAGEGLILVTLLSLYLNSDIRAVEAHYIFWRIILFISFSFFGCDEQILIRIHIY